MSATVRTRPGRDTSVAVMRAARPTTSARCDFHALVGGVPTCIRNTRLRRPTRAATSIPSTSATRAERDNRQPAGPHDVEVRIRPAHGLNPPAERHQNQRAERQPPRATRRKPAIEHHVQTRGDHAGHGAAEYEQGHRAAGRDLTHDLLGFGDSPVRGRRARERQHPHDQSRPRPRLAPRRSVPRPKPASRTTWDAEPRCSPGPAERDRDRDPRQRRPTSAAEDSSPTSA
jgi:hypothetical protein